MAKKKLKLDQLAKLRQFSSGMDVDKYLSSEFRQFIRALEQGYIIQDDVDLSPFATSAALNSATATSTAVISSSSGSFTATAVSSGDVTNLSVTITTTKSRVWVGLVAGSTAANYVAVTDFAGNKASARLAFIQDGVNVGSSDIRQLSNGATAVDLILPTSSFSAILENVTPGSHTYKVTYIAIEGTLSVINCKLKVFEM